jgi:hypothetical protein
MPFLAVLFAGVLLTVSGSFAEAHYVGTGKCAKMCHKSKNKGEQLVIWQASKHAKAYDDLATPAAHETAKKAGIAGDPQKSEKCLKCHVTAFGANASLIDSSFSIKDGVQCESCHGAGSSYAKLNIMKDKKLSIAAGMVEPTEKVCVKCHNSESPYFKGFKFDEMAKKIAHPVPKK